MSYRSPNGSRLSCGRSARRRKAAERQIKRLASEATQFLPTCEVTDVRAFLRSAFGQCPPDTYILRCHSYRRGPAVYRTAQLVLVAILAVVFGLSALSRRFPHVAWLQVFRYDRPQLSQEHQARMRQRSNIYAGVELILMGIILPM